MNNLELCDYYKIQTKTLLKNIFDILKNENEKITSVVLQYNSGNIYIGSTGIKKGDISKYYSSTDTRLENDITQFIENNNIKHIAEDLYKYIVDDLTKLKNQKSNVKSYNIIYKSKNDKLFICTNSIGSLSVKRSLIYKEF